MASAPQAAQGPLAGPSVNCGCGTPEEALCAEVLACLSAGWPPLPQPAAERRPAAAAASQSHSHSQSQTDSDCGNDDAECRPRKVRIVEAEAGSGSGSSEGVRARKVPARVPPAAGATSGLLQRRTYTWRGVSSRRAEKQQRQLDALQQQATEAAAPEAAAVAALEMEEASSCKEGARAWAALTTWLRMNIHNARTAKKVVLFVGQRAASGGRWAFALNPSLTWADVSPETRQRLQHLPQEAAQAFRSKYPTRSPEDWRLKSQKYKPPGTAQTSLVLLEDLVLSLHKVWQQHEGAAAATAAAAGSPDAVPAAAAPASPAATDSAAPASASCDAASAVQDSTAAAAELASCGSSSVQPAAAPAQ